MNDVSNRAVREFSEFLNSIEADFPETLVHLLFGVQRNQGTDDGAFHRDLVCRSASRLWKIGFDAVKELRKFPDSPVAHIVHTSSFMLLPAPSCRLCRWPAKE